MTPFSAAAPRIGVLALQGDVREHLRMLDEGGATGSAVRRPRELEQVDGIILPGGESTTMYKLARSFGLFEPLRDAVRDGLPAFGTCAGMIMLAEGIVNAASEQQTIGGLDVLVRRNAFGRQRESFEAGLDVTGMAEPFHALFIRAPVVEKVGEEVDVVARIVHGGGPEAAGRIVAVRQGHLMATSFHPEITGDHRFHGLFVDQVRVMAGGPPRPSLRDD